MKKNQNHVWFLATILFVLIGILGGMVYIKSVTPEEALTDGEVTTEAKAKPTPLPLHSGSAKFNVSQSKHEGPNFTSWSVDPLDVKKGQKYKVTVSLNNTEPITAVNGTLLMDNSTAELTFKQISGDATKGDWQAELRLTDSVDYTYTLSLSATGSNGVSKIKPSLR